MSLQLLCATEIPRSTGGHRVCHETAVILIVTEAEFFDARNGLDTWSSRLEATPVCAHHAPEEVHETSACMSPDEFTVIQVAFDVDSSAWKGEVS